MEIPCAKIKEINRNLNLHRTEEGPFRCSFCNKGFLTMQSLGGHQTVHRKEIKEMRKKHHDYMLTHHKRCAKKATSGARIITIATPCKDDRLRMKPLSPNRAFWKAQKKLKCGPKLYDFFGISNHWANMSDRIIGQIDPDHLFLGAIDLDLKL